MTTTSDSLNEQAASAAFSKQSIVFDEIYSGSIIINYKRERVRTHIEQYLKPNSTILELNSGTGEDATYFAKQGHYIHATDISAGMQHELRLKKERSGLSDQISQELCSFTDLEHLQNRGPYDLVFSNFAGLNCTGELDKVLHSLSPLLKTNGVIILVLLPKFCLWETLMLFKGKFRTAFRRFFSSKGVKAHVEGTYFKCWYYNPSYVINTLKNSFNLLSLEGLCTLVPPSYIENFAEKRPAVYRFLEGEEARLRNKWPWKFIGDYYIISLRKK